MPNKPSDKDLLPSLLEQNPSLVAKPSQDRITTKQGQVDRILAVFQQLLPSNYVSEVMGPHYLMRFQAAAEQIAEFQITAQEAFADGFWEYTRPEFLFQILGLMVFPDAKADGIPIINGDLSYRDFLRAMVRLLIQGATKKTIEDSLELLSDAAFEVIERGIEARQLGPSSAWGPDDKFTFEINVSRVVRQVAIDEFGLPAEDGVLLDLEGFPEDPFTLLTNLQLVMKALKPAHTLYDYRHLFHETFETLITAEMSWDMSSYYYEDTRKFCCGAKEVTGTEGVSWTDRSLFSDPSRDFHSILPGASLHILDGPNSDTVSSSDPGYFGRYRVTEVLGFPFSTGAVATGATLETLDGSTRVLDLAATFVSAGLVLGDLFVISTGKDIGTYRIVSVASETELVLNVPMSETVGGVSWQAQKARSYTTSPNSLFGTAFLSGDDIEDPSQDWSTADEGEQITFTEGPNAGTYRLKTALGSNGGPIGFAAGPATRVRISHSLLRIYGWVPEATTGQSYTVTVDRLGVVEPEVVLGEDVTSQFFGNLGDPNITSFLTSRGPLVKGWGDGTPATKNDITLYFNGNPAPALVDWVNPYNGEVHLASGGLSPVDPAAPAYTVAVDYKWFPCATFPMLLNTEGSVLNKHMSGMPKYPRFPMSVVLGPPIWDRWAPVQIGHRYLGYEQAYSALLNSPTTLLLNQPPGRVSVPAFERRLQGRSIAYEGTTKPVEASPVWALDGTDEGYVNIGEDLIRGTGTYTLIDSRSGDLDPDDPQAVVYHRGADASFPAAINVTARFFVEDYTPDGVFTGVAFGFHNNERLFLVGAVLVNGLQHVGFLRDPTQPQVADSWTLGPSTTTTIQTATTVEMVTAETPTSFAAGDRFQILGTSQEGVYTVESVVRQTDGSTTVTVTTPFPANPDLWGNKYIPVIFETSWMDAPSTYRLDVDPDVNIAVVTISGTLGGTVARINGSAASFPRTADTSLLLNPAIVGQVFWGSLSRRATNQSIWTFSRYSVVPDVTTLRDRRLIIETDGTVVPEDETAYPWFATQVFGFSQVDSSGTHVLLKNTSASETLDQTFGYQRAEPFFAPEHSLDLRSVFRVESGTLGAGDSQVVINDSVREVRLATLVYQEGFLGAEYRQLVKVPTVSCMGLQTPKEQGWFEQLEDPLSVEIQGNRLVLTQGAGGAVSYGKYLDLSELVFLDQGNRIIEARLAVTSYTANNEQTGISLSFTAGTIASQRYVQVRLRAPFGITPAGVDLYGPALIQQYNFDWTDGLPHTYRIVIDAVGDTVSLFVDDAIELPTQALSSFILVPSDPPLFIFSQTGLFAGPTVASTVEWFSTSYFSPHESSSKRTLGIYLGGDPDHINSWEIPRTDTSTAANSAQVGPVIEEMDWTSDVEVRLLRDPRWGVSMYRPDLGLPPYYRSDFQAPVKWGSGFATQTTEPSAGWINVEYRNLPKVEATFGFVAFGALDRRSITQQRWGSVGYTLYRHATEDYRAPQNMVLNRFNVINSGEMTRDTTPEQVIVETLTASSVTLLPTHLYADRIFSLLDGSTRYSPDEFLFERISQTATLLPDPETGEPVLFSGEHVPVLITFAPGQPVTNTYLLGQPLADGVTNLNEGTPPVPMSQAVSYDRYVVFGPDIVESVADMRLLVDDATNPTHVLGDPYRVLVTREDNDPDPSLYENMEFFELEDSGQTGLLSTICEGKLGPAGSSGWDPDPENGEPIYSPTGTGPELPPPGSGWFETGDVVGQPFGSFVLAFGGYEETEVGLQPDLNGQLGVGFTLSGAGTLGTLLSPGANPLGVLQPVLAGNGASQIQIIMVDSVGPTTTVWEFVG